MPFRIGSNFSYGSAKLRRLTIVLSVMAVNLLSQPLWANGTSLIGFTWLKPKEMQAAIAALKSDQEKNEIGYLLGPRYWKGLSDAQSDADHAAGDGHYFSINPLDSRQHGPHLLIMEIRNRGGQWKDLIQNLHHEIASKTDPKNLPAIVQYRGSWHVLKRLLSEKESEHFEVRFRKPRIEDADQIFQQMKMIEHPDSAFAVLSRLILGVKGDENKSTTRFLERLRLLILSPVLLPDWSKISSNPELVRSISSAISHVFWALRTREQKDGTQFPELKQKLFQKLLQESNRLPETILHTLQTHDPELAARPMNWKPACRSSQSH